MGATGEDCHTNIDDCNVNGQNVCKKNDSQAQCADALDSFTCACSRNYTGPTCEQSKFVFYDKILKLFIPIYEPTLEEIYNNSIHRFCNPEVIFIPSIFQNTCDVRYSSCFMGAIGDSLGELFMRIPKFNSLSKDPTRNNICQRHELH